MFSTPKPDNYVATQKPFLCDNKAVVLRESAHQAPDCGAFGKTDRRALLLEPLCQAA
jgi:hypothetical protein